MGCKGSRWSSTQTPAGYVGVWNIRREGINFSVLYVDLMDISSQWLILNDVKLSVLLAASPTVPALRSSCRELLTLADLLKTKKYLLPKALWSLKNFVCGKKNMLCDLCVVPLSCFDSLWSNICSVHLFTCHTAVVPRCVRHLKKRKKSGITWLDCGLTEH